MQFVVTEWSQEVSDLRARYTWLLFFSVPKMLLLHKLMHSPPLEGEKIDNVFHEVSFLVANKRENLRSNLQVSIGEGMPPLPTVLSQDVAGLFILSMQSTVDFT